MQGKLNIISVILKIDRPFRASTVTEMTGFDRALVYYHLKSLTEEGILTKTGKVYQIEDRESLVNGLVELTETAETALMQYRNTLFNKAGVEAFNRMAEAIVSARIMDEPMSLDVKVALIRDIDNTVKELKKLRKFLNNSQRGYRAAVRFYKKSERTLGEWYDAMVTAFDFTPRQTKEEFVNHIKMAMEVDTEEKVAE